MSKDRLKGLKLKQVEYLIQTKEYKEELSIVGENIYKKCLEVANEASAVSVFELELFSFIKDVTGLKYYPEKEKTVNTERHISKGRIDSKIGALVIEFKHLSKLKNEKQKSKATEQLIDYLKGLYKLNNVDYFGLVTDGTICKFIQIENGLIQEGIFEKLNFNHLDSIIRAIVLLEKVALTPENLVKDFCTPIENSLSKRLTLCLFSSLSKTPTGKTKMLFNEWKELFRLAHDDHSKQQAIQERRQSLEEIVGSKIKSNDDEYLILYAIQSTYAIIVKIIAYKVISKIRFNKSLIDFNTLSKTDFDTLRYQMSSLEEGAIFRSLGIGNLLEGDFFSWYSTDEQWSDEIGGLIQEIFLKLSAYEDKAVFEKGENITDLFRDLFMTIIPDKVRHSLGEFYTPSWLADNLISETLKLIDYKEGWTSIDPCSGSGTFVTVLIKKVIEEVKDLDNKEKLKSILQRVKGIDLNPLAVLTTRINYFINISPFVSDDDEFEIPVYLGDSSYVPEKIVIAKVKCLSYNVQTIKGFIEIVLPQSIVKDPIIFSRTMTSIEEDIKNLDSETIYDKLLQIIDSKDKKTEILDRIRLLAEKFVELEKNDWNGIWARIVTNFLTTANLGKFDIIVGNPPWIDWKNLPAGYRERIKSICLSRHLFSGDGITGGINLNICALISNVVAQNWLKEKGVLSFLMPQSLIFQQTYEGFRDLIIDDNKKLYFQQFFDWTKSGHPFAPVQHKFLTFFISSKERDYNKGVTLKYFKKKRGVNLKDYKNINNFSLIEDSFSTESVIVGHANKNNSIFSYANSSQELKNFRKISGESIYLGRDGIDFYPQELFLLEIDKDLPITSKKVFLKNFQTKKSKHKIPQTTFPLETSYLYPLVKSTEIKRFHIETNKYFVPFPYAEDKPRTPISIKELTKASPLLAKYFNQLKSVFGLKTNYNKKIIGKKYNTEFYSLTRVGVYTYADYFVTFRKDTKWVAAVAGKIETPWGELKSPRFQSHAVSISQDKNGNFISEDEAHFICAVLNSKIVGSYVLNSSDSRSFKVRPQIHIPKYESKNVIHLELSKLSKKAHENYNDVKIIESIDKRLDQLIVKI
jgi:hypothetical protein